MGRPYASVARMERDGSALTKLNNLGSDRGVYFVAAENGTVCWSSATQIGSASPPVHLDCLVGGTQHRLASFSDDVLWNGTNRLAVHGGWLYFAFFERAVPRRESIMRVPTNGGSVETLRERRFSPGDSRYESFAVIDDCIYALESDGANYTIFHRRVD